MTRNPNNLNILYLKKLVYYVKYDILASNYLIVTTFDISFIMSMVSP